MYRVLEENVMLRLGYKWYATTAVLTGVSGGKQINYVAEDGTLLKSQAFSRSQYSRVVKSRDGFGEEVKSSEEMQEKPSFSDPDFMGKMTVYNKKLRELGLEDTKSGGINNEYNSDSSLV